MSIKALQDYTYVSKYARYRADKKRRETWNEAVTRVEEMHLKKYPQVAEEIRWAFDRVREKKVLGSQRALQFGGTPIEKKNARVYNCTVSFCDRVRFFQEAFWLLLCGCGVGFSVQKHHIEKLPGLFNYSRDKLPTETYVIPDTIEGWADALGILLATYMPHPDFPEWEGKRVKFSFKKIREKGANLSSGVGKAPGPEPLRRSLEVIQQLMDRIVSEGHKKLKPIHCYDIIMHASDAVLSGGVRRSASICLFSPNDVEMASAKIGNWMNENPQRARSNNSALLLRDKTDKETFEALMTLVKEYGEPGFVWSDSTELVVNPCVEIGMCPVHWKTKESGWQMCNLAEINGRYIKSEEDFAIAAQAAAIIGTLQAGYTKFEYLGKTTEEIVEREALLGVSITGMMDNPEIIFDPKIQRKMAKLVVKTNEQMAEKIGINAAARCTCVKPAGSTSCVLGTSSGIHPNHARRYFRRIQANQLEAPLQHFKMYNPTAVEKSVWSANKTDEVVTFVIEVPDGAKTKNDIGAITLLEHVKLTQQNWVTYGTTVERCTQPWLRHNVSNTINVKPDEWDEVSDYIYNNRKYFAGIALLPQSGDLDYPQAPMVTVHTPRELLQIYGDGVLLASGLIVDGLYAFDNNLWQACDAALGVITPQEPSKAEYNGSWEIEYRKFGKKKDWIRRVEQFAERYCEGSVKKTTYLLKEVNNWKLWLDLNREYQEVDYEQMIEEQDNTKVQEEWACSGGKCELV